MIAMSRSGTGGLTGGLEQRIQGDTGSTRTNVVHMFPMALNVQGQVVSNNSDDTHNLPAVIASYEQFWRTEGKHLESRYGKPRVDVAQPGSEDLGHGNVAAYAVLKSGHRVLLGDRNYTRKLHQFAQSYGLDSNLANRYIWLHEFAHSKGMATEEGAEQFVKNYAEQRIANAKDPAELREYQLLATVARERMRFGRRLDEMRRNKAARQYNLTGEPQAQPQALETSIRKLASSYGLSPTEAYDYARRADAIRVSGTTSPADVAQKLARAYAVLANQHQGEMHDRYKRLAEVANREAEQYKHGASRSPSANPTHNPAVHGESDESRQRYAAASGGGSKYKGRSNKVPQAKAA